MQTIKFSDLVIPKERQRKTFDPDKLEDLAARIQEVGLLQAPVVQDDGRTLVAGHRRSLAMAMLFKQKVPFFYNGIKLPEGEMPVVRIGNLDAIAVREAELQENLCRVDLTWQEEAHAIAELAKLRQEQNPDTTSIDIAKEISGEDTPSAKTYNTVRDVNLLQNHLDDEEVMAAKTPKEAIKIARKKEQAKVKATLAELASTSGTEHEIRHADTRTELFELPDKTYSVLLTDPPYGVNADSFGDQASAAHEYRDDLTYALELVDTLAQQSYRACKDQAHAYVFCDIRHWPKFCEIFARHGWDVWQTPLLWIKQNGMLPRPDHGPRRCYEAILYAIKGGKEVNAVHPDILPIKEVSRPTFGAEKPWELYENLLRRSVMPGDKVLDAFAGAGPIIPASNKLGLSCTVIERNKEKVDHMMLRLEEEKDG